MQYKNNATHVRRELLVKVASLAFEGKLIEGIDRVPIEIIPKGKPSVRCCIHHDRAVVKYRLKAMLGFSVEEEEDELKPLSAFAAEASGRERVEGPVLTVIDEACSACVKSHYFVTNACRACVARPCVLNCPKRAISILNGQARIDSSSCVNCGLCQNVCPYHAIVKVPIPCEEACPVGAISKDGNGKEKIDFSRCILCGKCMNECPFGAIVERSQMVDVIRALGENRPVIALVAPAIAGEFPGDFRQLVTAIKRIGFREVWEVAVGADQTAEREGAEWVERMEEGHPFLTTSCCPAYTECVEKHLPELKPYVSTTKSPMLYAAEMVRSTLPEGVIVFIGPCVAKKKEALRSGLVDYVLNTEEMGAMLVAREIDVPACEPSALERVPSAEGRSFPMVGGVSKAVIAAVRAIMTASAHKREVKPHIVDGLDAKGVKLLRQFPKGQAEGNLIEVMACKGGCVAGPATIGKPAMAAKKIEEWVKKEANVEKAVPAR